MLRRGLVLDLSIAFGKAVITSRAGSKEAVALPSPRNVLTSGLPTAGLGTAMAYYFWYRVHIPSVRRRDDFYNKLEDKREAESKQ